MTKEVVVTISGFQIMGGDSQEDMIELVHIGEYYERNGTHYVLFEEIMEGMSHPVKNIIKIKDRSLEVQKKGPVAVNMLFEEGRSQRTTYAVPYGSFLMEIGTKSVRVRREEELLEVKASYGLGINGEHCADCDIHVKIQPKECFRL